MEGHRQHAVQLVQDVVSARATAGHRVLSTDLLGIMNEILDEYLKIAVSSNGCQT